MPIRQADADHEEGSGVRAVPNESGLSGSLASQRLCKPISSAELMLRVEQEIADAHAVQSNR